MVLSKKTGVILIIIVALSALPLIVACNAQQPETVTIVETVVVEKEVQGETVTVVETVEVVKEVEKVVEVQGPIPYPEEVPLNLEEVAVERVPIDQIMTYKALPKYNEPDWITDLVNQGELPPLEDRLPKEPQVVLESGMPDGIGQYGDAWRDFSACPTAGWNHGAGVTAGWFGIEAFSISEGSLVKTGPLYRADQDLEPMPNLAKSWEWSADGKELTMHLIEGAKWSDGEPFTSEDVMFTWEDYINDPNVNSWKTASSWEFDGKPATLEAIDDYTIKFTFPVEKPVEKYYLMDEQDFDVMPAHLLKPLHPKYNSDMDYKEFENALPPDAVPIPTMGPWVPVEYRTDELLVMRRNPYYWKVDEAGNQLPYLDEVVFQKGPTGAGRGLCTIAGGCDHANLENPQAEFIEALKRAQEPDAHYTIDWGPELLGFYVQINQSADLGVKDERDATMRQLFRDVRFRRALSYATDRDGIAQATMRGPFLRAWAGGLMPGSPEFERESVVYYSYAPDAARTLLAELGFEDTDGNGILNWTSGPLEGQDLIVSMFANEDALESINIGEALVNNWGEVGIQVNFRPITSAVYDQEMRGSGEWDMHVRRSLQEYALPFARCTDLAPIAKNAPHWHVEGEKPRQLQPFEEELVKIVEQYCVERDPAKRKELINQYNHIFTENVYNIGVFVSRYGLALAKRFQNVPPGSPVFLYNWIEYSIMPEQVWTPADEQIEEIRPNTIPVYNN